MTRPAGKGPRETSSPRLHGLLGRRFTASRPLRALLYLPVCARLSVIAPSRGEQSRFLAVCTRLIVRDLLRAQGSIDAHITVGYRGQRVRLQVDQINDFDVIAEVFGEGEYEGLPVTAPGLILDIGAHIGAVSLALHSTFPDAEIVAVEADPRTFRLLQANLAPAANLRAIHAAVTTEDGPTGYNVSRDGWASSLGSTFEVTERTTVPGVTFPTLLADLGITFVPLVKIDIEGAEYDLLHSVTDGQLGTVIMEWHSDIHGHDVSELAQLLPGHTTSIRPLGTAGRYVVLAQPADPGGGLP